MFNLWTLLGLVFLLLASAGLVLPLLPTTPFVLLAVGCFAKSSPRMHAWVLSSRLFGPTVRDWERSRCISRRTRWVGLGLMLALGGVSVFHFIQAEWLRIAGLILIGIGSAVLLSLKVCPNAGDPPA